MFSRDYLKAAEGTWVRGLCGRGIGLRCFALLMQLVGNALGTHRLTVCVPLNATERF